MNQAQSPKWMSNGEAGLAVFFSATAFLCLIAAAKAVDTAFAFHATLGAAASLWAVFAIFNRYFDRPYALPPQEINGRPNYNLGPIKFASAISVFWGIAGFTVGLLIASPARLAGAQFRPAMDQLRPAAAAAYIRGGVRIRRQCADRDIVLCRSKDLQGPSRRRSRALVCRARLQFLHFDCRHRLPARGHAIKGIRRTGMVRRPLADDRLGHLSAGVPDDAGQAQGTAHLRRKLVLPRLHHYDRSAAPRQQSGHCRCRCSDRSPTSSGAAFRMPCSSGGMDTTRSASS